MKRFDYLTEMFGVVFTIIQTNEIFQLISLILTCLATAVSLSLTIYLWFKKAMKDGKITEEEIEELKDEIEKKGK